MIGGENVRTEGRTKEGGGICKNNDKKDVLELMVEFFETPSKRGDEAKLYGEKGPSRPLLRGPVLHQICPKGHLSLAQVT